MKVFIGGLGYVGKRVADALIASNHHVTATSRDPSKTQSGVRMVRWPDDSHLINIHEFTHFLFTAPPTTEGDPFISSFSTPPLHPDQWCGYLSATNVYGDHGGQWVDERSKTNPLGERGKRRLMAENQWKKTFPELTIFRLAGIYGPDQSIINQIQNGTAQRIDKPDHAFSRIHVDDIVQCILLAMQKNSRSEILNIADDLPSPTADTIAYACDIMGVQTPPLIPFDFDTLSPQTQDYYRENKKVSNQNMKDLLGARLIFPTYREGLLKIWKKESAL